MPKKSKQSKIIYRFALHRRHPSGIGSIFIRYEYTEIKPSFDSSFWIDSTNHEWARYNKWTEYLGK